MIYQDCDINLLESPIDENLKSFRKIRLLKYLKSNDIPL